MKRPTLPRIELPGRRQVAAAHGAVLKSIREGTTGLSQEEFAERSETDASYVSRLEQGKGSPNLWMFIKCAAALDVDPVLMLQMTLARLRGDL